MADADKPIPSSESAQAEGSKPSEDNTFGHLKPNEPQRIYILKGNQNSLVGAENYLRKRDWRVDTSTNLKLALVQIIQNRPDFVFVSADHPHPKALIIPKVLVQVFPCFVIGFAESVSRTSMNNLERMGTQHTMVPPISGPKIERIINKIIIELQSKTPDQRLKMAQGANAASSNVISVRGGAAGDTTISGGTADSARAAIQAMLSGNDEESSESISGGQSGNLGLAGEQLSGSAMGAGSMGPMDGFGKSQQGEGGSALMRGENQGNGPGAFGGGYGPGSPGFNGQGTSSSGDGGYAGGPGFGSSQSGMNSSDISQNGMGPGRFGQAGGRDSSGMRSGDGIGQSGHGQFGSMDPGANGGALNGRDNFGPQSSRNSQGRGRSHGSRDSEDGSHAEQGGDFGHNYPRPGEEGDASGGHFGDPRGLTGGPHRKNKKSRKKAVRRGPNGEGIDEDGNVVDESADPFGPLGTQGYQDAMTDESGAVDSDKNDAASQGEKSGKSSWGMKSQQGRSSESEAQDDLPETPGEANFWDNLAKKAAEKKKQKPAASPEDFADAFDELGAGRAPLKARPRPGESRSEHGARIQEFVKKRENKIQRRTQGREAKDIILMGNAFADGESFKSMIDEATYRSLKETVVVEGEASEQVVAKIEKATHIACIVVESPKFSGYLVAALGNNRKIDKDFVETVRGRLKKFLKEKGEEISDKESMELSLQEVEFSDWALQQAEFLRKAVHRGDEIAMAFFPAKTEQAELKKSKKEHMLMIGMEELKEDTPVEFDLYVYLPENDKYILYTPRGKKFLGEQKLRLSARGVQQMHLRKESSGDVKRYRVQNFLNEKIQSYKSKRTSP